MIARALKLTELQKKPGRAARTYVLGVVGVTVPTLIGKLRGALVIPFLITALGLGEYGAWVQIIIFANLLAFLSTLGLHTSLVRYYPEGKTESEQKSLVFTVLLVTAICSLTTAVTLLIFSPLVTDWLLRDVSSVNLVRMGILLIPLSSFNLILLNIFRAKNQIQTYATFKSLFEVTDFAVIVSVTLLFPSLHTLLLCNLLTLLASNVTLIFGHIREWRVFPLPPISMKAAYRYIRYSLPVIPASFSDEIAARGDRLLVGFFLGPVAVGAYSVVYALASLPAFLHAPIVDVLFPKLSHFRAANQRPAAVRYMRGTLLVMTLLGLGLLTLIVVLRDWLWPLMTNSTTELTTGDALPSLLFVAGLGVIFYALSRIMMLSLFTIDQTRLTLLPYGLAAAINVVMNLLLIPSLGLMGAVVATLVAYFCMMLITFWLVRKRGMI